MKVNIVFSSITSNSFLLSNSSSIQVINNFKIYKYRINFNSLSTFHGKTPKHENIISCNIFFSFLSTLIEPKMAIKNHEMREFKVFMPLIESDN